MHSPIELTLTKKALFAVYICTTYIKVYVKVDMCVFDPKIISYCPLWDSILNRTLLSTHSSELMPNAQHILILNCVPFDFEVETTKYLLLACVSVSNYQNSKSLLVHRKRLHTTLFPGKSNESRQSSNLTPLINIYTFGICPFCQFCLCVHHY